MLIGEYPLEIVKKQLKSNGSTDSAHTPQTALPAVLTP